MRPFFIVVPTVAVAAVVLTGCFHEDWGHGASHGGGHYSSHYSHPTYYVAPAPAYAHAAPNNHSHWVEGRWVHGDHGNVWVPGHWEDD